MQKYIVDVQSKKSKEAYGVIIIVNDDGEVIFDKSLCCCKYGSFYRFTHKNNGKPCKHMQVVIDLIKRNKLIPGVSKEVLKIEEEK